MKVELSDTEVFTVVNGLETAAERVEGLAVGADVPDTVKAALRESAQHYRKQAENIQQQWEDDE